MIYRHAKIKNIRSGDHIGKFVGWHLFNSRIGKYGRISGHGYALRRIHNNNISRVRLDKSTEYQNGVIIHHTKSEMN